MSQLVPIRPFERAGLPSLGERSCSLDLSTREGQLLAYRAATSRDATLDELVGQKVEVANYLSHWIEDRGEHPAEHGMRRRIVLIGPDGSLVSTGSETAWRCVLAAAEIMAALPPWQPPLRFLVRHHPRADKKGHFILLEWCL